MRTHSRMNKQLRTRPTVSYDLRLGAQRPFDGALLTLMSTPSDHECSGGIRQAAPSGHSLARGVIQRHVAAPEHSG